MAIAIEKHHEELFFDVVETPEYDIILEIS
jgi:hypothetical protein